MTLDANACGVIATVIPVYFLVLVVGDQRLVRSPGPGPGVSAMDRLAKALVAGLTIGELLALAGLAVGGYTAGGWQTLPLYLLGLATVYAVVITAAGTWFALDSARRDLEHANLIDVRVGAGESAQDTDGS